MPIEEPTATPSRVPPKSRPNRLQLVRQLHLYLGTLFAPALLFFSLTGALQLFGLHESRPGSTYQAPQWIATLAQVHKHQTLTTPPKRPASTNSPNPRGEGNRPTPSPKPPEYSLSTALLRFFFLLAALGLIFTTGLGVYMAFKFNRNPKLVWGLLIVGTVVPCGLLMM